MNSDGSGRLLVHCLHDSNQSASFAALVIDFQYRFAARDEGVANQYGWRYKFMPTGDASDRLSEIQSRF